MYSRGHLDSPDVNRDESRRLADGGRQQSRMRNARVFGAPPGSKTGACAHRGSLGTRESRLSPCRDNRKLRCTGLLRDLALSIFSFGWMTSLPLVRVETQRTEVGKVSCDDSLIK